MDGVIAIDEACFNSSEFYHTNFSDCQFRFLEWGGDLLGQFRKLRDAGCLEIMATAATHGLLPLLQQSPEAVRAQILIGCDIYRATFGADPVGFWLPECAYAPGLEMIMQEANLRWFIVDAHGLMFGEPRPRRGIYAPSYTAAGPAAFARDRDSSRQVWERHGRLSGDPAYREFYRDIGFDLPLEYLRPGSANTARKFTGLNIIDHGPRLRQGTIRPGFGRARRGGTRVSFPRGAAPTDERAPHLGLRSDCGGTVRRRALRPLVV